MWKGLVERANGKLIYIAPGSVCDGCRRVNTFMIINIMIITDIFTYIIMVIVLGDGDQNEANVACDRVIFLVATVITFLPQRTVIVSHEGSH